jgi:hypothetical protein
LRLCDAFGQPADRHPKNVMIVRLDVERDPQHALETAAALKEVGVLGTFHFQTRRDSYDKEILNEIQNLGHEVGYHHECLDRCRGDFEAARNLFRAEVEMFRRDGIDLRTSGHHSELLLPRRGYENNYSLLLKFPELMNETRLVGEEYFAGATFPNLACFVDTFRRCAGFLAEIRESDKSRGLYVQAHPHRWRSSKLGTATEVFRDLRQAFLNRFCWVFWHH